MKYPFEFSEQRLSLLSKEERDIYDYEHSDFFSVTEREDAIKEYNNKLNERKQHYMDVINEDEEYNDMSINEKAEFADELVKYETECMLSELCDLMKDSLAEGLDIEDYTLAKKYAISEFHNIMAINEIDSLTPNGGKNFLYWLKDAGWLGKLVGGLLTTMLGGVIYLIMKGKDKAAMHELEKYMNKIVEKVDDGLYKKKSTLGKLLGRFGFGKNDGDQSEACFRTIQENFSKKIASDAMVMMKNLGFLSSNWSSSIKDLESNRFNNGGMEMFLELVERPVKQLQNKI